MNPSFRAAAQRGKQRTKARPGGGVRLGFEGGQTPLFRRIPNVVSKILIVKNMQL